MSTTDTQIARNSAPTHTAYQIRSGEKKNYWKRIGAAWVHKGGKGFSVQLESMPLDGRVTLRTVPAKR